MGANTGTRPTNPKKSEIWRRIDSMCRWCLYDRAVDGTWVQQVNSCTAGDCPLYPIRRVSTPEKRKATGGAT